MCGGAVSRGGDDAPAATSPPVRPTAPVAKTAPKPARKKGLGVPYGSYSNIREVMKHFGGHLATEQRGVSDVNVCPWSRLEGAGRWPMGGRPPPEAQPPQPKGPP